MMKQQTLLKWLLVALVSMILPGWAQAGDSSKYVADYYKAHYSEYLNKKIRLKVAFVKPSRRASPVEGVQFFLLMTSDTSDDVVFGGTMIAAVPQSSAGKFADRYGVDPDIDGHRGSRKIDTKKLSGMLRVFENDLFYLDVDGDLHETILKHEKEVREFIRDEMKGPDGGHGHGPGRPGPGKGRL